MILILRVCPYRIQETKFSVRNYVMSNPPSLENLCYEINRMAVPERKRRGSVCISRSLWFSVIIEHCRHRIDWNYFIVK